MCSHAYDSSTHVQKAKDEEVTPQQALHWMGFIEQRTTEIVQFYQVLGAAVKCTHAITPTLTHGRTHLTHNHTSSPHVQAHLNSQKGKHPRTPSRKVTRQSPSTSNHSSPRCPLHQSTQDDLNFQRGPSAPSGKLREHLDASIHKIINITSNRPKK